MIKKNTTVLFILNIFCSSVSNQQLKLNSETEFNYSGVTGPTRRNLFNFRQRLNHKSGYGEWFQRYAVIVEFYKKNGPAFLFVNGARSMDEGYEFPYHVKAYAKNFNAIIFSIEHRFYGRTHPINGSIVHHLNTAQALADIANFIKGVPKEFNLPKQLTWILFGCSYGGRLAALARLKYPHLIHGSVVSSSPLLSIVDYYEYDQIVEESLKSYDSSCVESIMAGFEEIASLVNNPRNKKNLSQMFGLYDPIIDTDTVKSYIIHIVLDILSDAVQNNQTISISVPVVCRIMTEYTGTKLQAFAELRKMNMEGKDNTKMQSEKKQEVQNSATDFEESRIDAWDYQRCSEYGYFSSYTNTTYLSPVKHLLRPIEMEIEIVCDEFYGPNFSIKNLTEKIAKMNSEYGGLDFNIDNTLFIHGSFDPWYKAGLYMNSKDSLYETIFIKGTSHCDDIYRPTDKDIPELRNARNKIFKILQSWLKTNSASTNSEN